MYVFAFFSYSLQTCILANIRICKGNYFEILLNYLYVRRINQLFILKLSYTDDYNNISFISRSYGFCTAKKLLKYLMKGGFSQLAVFLGSNIRVKLKKIYLFLY